MILGSTWGIGSPRIDPNHLGRVSSHARGIPLQHMDRNGSMKGELYRMVEEKRRKREEEQRP